MVFSTSFLMSSLTPKTLAPVSCKTVLPFKSNTNTNIVSFPVPVRRFQRLASRFVRNVAVTSEFEQEQEQEQGQGREREGNFSAELKLFVGNLPFNVDSTELAGLFADAGTVEMVEVIYDKMTGRSRGFGFVTMSSAAEVKAAEEQFNGYELEGRPLRVNAGPPPPKREDGGPRGGGRRFDNNNRLHISNLSWEVDDSALKTLFSEQGSVLDAKVITDRDTGRSRGFGFVTYGSAEEVNSAIKFLDGVDLKGRDIRVSVAETKPRPSY